MSLRLVPDLPALLLPCGSAGGLLAAQAAGADAAGAVLRRHPGALVVPGDPGLAVRLRRNGAWLVLAWRRGQLACMLTP